MQVAIISDTHVPSRAATVPPWVLDRVRAADHVLHAGDFDSVEAYEVVREAAPALTAVHGNMDPALDLPTVATVDLGGVRFVLTHGTGDLEHYTERVAGVVREHAAEGPTVGISGHTHQVTDEVVDGLRLLNPGSATGAAPATVQSIMTAEVAEGDLAVEVHER